MLYYDRISEGIDFAKSSKSKECMVWHYSVFNHGFKFRDDVCSGCLDLKILFFNISDITIITVKSVDYRCITHNISNLKQLIQ